MKKSFGFYSFIFIIVIISPLLGSYLGGVYVDREYKQKIMDEQNEPWKQIPSSYFFTKIVDANTYSIWAETADHKLYYFFDRKCIDEMKCKEWIKTESVPENAHDSGGGGELPMRKGTTCPGLLEHYQKIPPERVIECAIGPYQTVVSFGTYYALLEDGTIWYWETPVPTDSPATIYGAFWGFTIGFKVSIAILIMAFIYVIIQNIFLGKKKQGNKDDI